MQVGAFRSRQSADDLIAQLRLHGFTGTLVADGFYRVWVGGVLSRVDAEQLAADLQAAGFETFLKSL